MKEKQNQFRKETSIRSMYFNRFLLLRYIVAIFLFFNLYWFVFSFFEKSITSIIPGVLMISLVLVIYEQVKLYRETMLPVKKTKLYFTLQCVVNVVVAISVVTGTSADLFPFLVNSQTIRNVLLTISLLGILLCIISLIRIKKITESKDVQLNRVKEDEKILNR